MKDAKTHLSVPDVNALLRWLSHQEPAKISRFSEGALKPKPFMQTPYLSENETISWQSQKESKTKIGRVLKYV